ncbi:hypothetical protein ACIOZL_19505 [Streptomyces sp. NPDC087769]|uniref:hypothetical protein n=1 Tax=Streptomyces sp. NPDC087769 TaxID=3365802 RepID=UPI0038040CCC
MGFLSSRKQDARAAVAAGDPERAADIIVHALLEGGGSFDQNLTGLVAAEPTEEPTR